MLFHELISLSRGKVSRLMSLVLIIGVLLIILGNLSTASVSGQNVETYCAPEEQPAFVFGFAKVKRELGQAVGEPVECEHYDAQGNAYQKTTRGLLFYDKAANQITFSPSDKAENNSIPTASSLIADYSMTALRADSYGQEGEIEVVRPIGSTATFRRYEIAYPSDGLRIAGFMNVPFGEQPFPVIIVNHGYMPPQSYNLLTYTTKYADSLAAAGFLVIHPNYRNHRGSGYGVNPYRIAYARDILNLIPMAQRLPQADGKAVGLWGHSMGGGITLRTLTVSNQVKAAVLYGANSGDEAKNWQQWGRRRQRSSYINYPDPSANAQLNAAISPLNHLRYINAALAIHHGAQDSQVPYAWSQELAQTLDQAGIPYHFYRYAYQDHNFTGADLNLFNQRVIGFFSRHLK